MKQYDTFTGIFKPKRLDTLRPEFLPLIGQKMHLRALWIIDHESDYIGQWAFESPEASDWVVEEDLEDLKPIHFVKYKEIVKELTILPYKGE